MAEEWFPNWTILYDSRGLGSGTRWYQCIKMRGKWNYRRMKNWDADGIWGVSIGYIYGDIDT